MIHVLKQKLKADIANELCDFNQIKVDPKARKEAVMIEMEKRSRIKKQRLLIVGLISFLIMGGSFYFWHENRLKAIHRIQVMNEWNQMKKNMEKSDDRSMRELDVLIQKHQEHPRGNPILHEMNLFRNQLIGDQSKAGTQEGR